MAKKLLIALALVLAIAVTAAGCFGPTDSILLEQDSYTHEYGEIFLVPTAECTNGLEVTVQIFDANGEEIPVEYGMATLELGEYKMVFTAGDVTREVPLSCVDSVAPQLFLSVSSTAAVGHWLTLPNVTADDISGIDASKTKIELYIEGQDTPIASNAGERVRVEEVSAYIVKATAADNAGNVASVEKKISVIVRPDTEVLQDFTTEVDAYWNSNWGGGEAEFKWYDQFEGKQGVIGLGIKAYPDPENGYLYAWWTGLGMDNLNLAGLTGITLRMRAENCRAIMIRPEFNGESLSIDTTGIGEWTDVYINLVNYEGIFTDLSKATIGFVVAPMPFVAGPVVWVDEVIAHYAPLPEYTVTVENGSTDYAYDTIPEGKNVTVKHDASKAPEGKVFAYYMYNGERLWGDTITVTENATLTAVYVDLVTEEKPIPEGATLVTDFSSPVQLVQDTGWGGGPAISAWYATYEGVAGVVSLGVREINADAYLRWAGILPPYFNYEDFTHITFRVRLTSSALRAFWVWNLSGREIYMDYSNVADGEWVDIKVPVSEIGSLMVGFANVRGTYGELIQIDQIYATVEEDGSEGNEPEVNEPTTEPTDPPLVGTIEEIAIPEGAVMIQDFAVETEAMINDMFGHCGANASSTYLPEIDGRGGVLALTVDTAERRYLSWGVAMGDAGCFGGYSSITIRMKVVGNVLCGYYGTNGAGTGGAAASKDCYDWPANEWFELTLTEAELGDMAGFNVIYLGGATESEGAAILIDQIYGTPKA